MFKSRNLQVSPVTNKPVINIVLQRLRAPLIILIVSYAVAVMGLTMIPGVDAQGNEHYFSYFHAFYFFSYVATTIGFGEIPYTFTDEQRLWVVFCIYLTVIAWLVAIGKIITLFQDPAFNFALNRARMTRKVRRINQPFCIICGYGQSGETLLRELHLHGYVCVVLEKSLDRLSVLDLENSLYASPNLNADASDPNNLDIAGINSPHCKAVITLTDNDRVNVKIALAAKLLRPDVKVICKVYSKESVANAESFDTDYVINPFRVFAEKFVMGFRTPHLLRLIETLQLPAGSEFPPSQHIPTGKWILCGYSRFGKEVSRYLEYEGIDVTIIDKEVDEEKSGFVRGRATEAIALRKAGIDQAVGIIAGFADDADNLSVIMTARSENPNLYLVARQNMDSNQQVFQTAKVDVVVRRSSISVKNIAPLIVQPAMMKLIKRLRHMDERFGEEMMQVFETKFAKTPEIYQLILDDTHAKPVQDVIRSEQIIRLQDLLTDPRNDGEQIFPAVPLLLIRDGEYQAFPKLSTSLQIDDCILLASSSRTADEIRYTMQSETELHFILNGKEKPVSIVFDWLKARYEKLKNNKSKQRAKHK